VFSPPSCNGCRIQQLGSGEPHTCARNWVKHKCLCIQGVFVNTTHSLLAAAMGRGHPLLTALALHQMAACTLFAGHRRISNHTGHGGGQKRRHHQDQCAESAKIRHRLQVDSQLIRLTRDALRVAKVTREMLRPGSQTLGASRTPVLAIQPVTQGEL